MVNGFRIYSNALKSIRGANSTDDAEGKDKSAWEELRSIGTEVQEGDQIRLVSYWVFCVNPGAILKDYDDVPLIELLEAYSVWEQNREYELKFHAQINGAKLK